jgi:hypothetical protein
MDACFCVCGHILAACCEVAFRSFARGEFVVFENLSPWRRLWPIAGLAAAVLVTAAWIGALGYAVVQLLS